MVNNVKMKRRAGGMTKTIQISDNLYERLAKYARGFDAPAAVIERILNEKEGKEEGVLHEPKSLILGKDYTKYKFNGAIYSKARLVHAVVRQYILDNPQTTYNELLEIFPSELQAYSLSVFEKFQDAVERYKNKQPRYYIKPEMKIKLSDCDIAVCNQWGVLNLSNFTNKAKELGYDIEAV